MAATGGGKIRTRRYYIASKPYAKNKQQGIIKRVTDTVKNIVPNWLQRYFTNNEETDTQIQDRQQTAQEQETEENDPVNLEEDDILHIPEEPDVIEPSASSREQSISRSTLNSQDTLARPPLNRSHLSFPTLDSPLCQPSTSAAFPIGSSGFSLVKEIKDSTSLHEDDNISTTSGFSSRASDKDVTTTRNSSLPIWSTEMDVTNTVVQQAGSSVRKPAFNLSVFGPSSASPGSSSLLNSSRLGDSPFYPGKTTYGGAASVKSFNSRGRGCPYQAPVRQQIKAKQTCSPSFGVTSATARRILQSLERMSSPLADAKRIPSSNSLPLHTNLDSNDQECSSLQCKRKKTDVSCPPVQNIVTPKAASVAVSRSHFKPSLTPSGRLSRVNETSIKERIPPKQLGPFLPDPTMRARSSFPLSSTPASNGLPSGGAGGKMKRERTGHASVKFSQEGQVKVPDLPRVALPISKTTMPSFSFQSSLSSDGIFNAGATTVSNKVSSPDLNGTAFTFSSPIVKVSEPSLPPLMTSPGFTFSAPLAKNGPNFSLDVPVTSALTRGKAKHTSASSDASPGSKNGCQGLITTAKTLKQGSVLDVLRGPDFTSPSHPSSSESSAQTKPLLSSAGSHVSQGLTSFDKFKPAKDSWKCDACLLQNKATDSKCIACSALKPNATEAVKAPVGTSGSISDSSKTSASESAPSLLEKFKPPLGTWDCDTCLIQNKPELLKCVACETAKPGTGVKPALTLPSVEKILTPSSTSSTSISTAVSSQVPVLGFGDKFKKPEGAWDCETCYVRNKAEDIKCVSCQSAKPGAAATQSVLPSNTTTASLPSGGLMGLGDKFKKPEGSWECDTCLVDNKPEASVCVACQTSKPGTKVELKGFGPPALPTTTAFPFTFGVPSSTSTATAGVKFEDFGGVKLVTPAGDSASSNPGGFGGKFKFGIGSSEQKTDNSERPSSKTFGSEFKFSASNVVFGTGSSSIQTDSSSHSGKEMSAGFSFGQSGSSEVKASEGRFKFGTPNDKNDLGSSSTPTFTFGKTEEKKVPEEKVSTLGFAFGKPIEKEACTSAATSTTSTLTVVNPTFTFGKNEQKQDSNTGTTFTFGKEAEAPASLGFPFTKQQLAAKDDIKSTFELGKTAEKQENVEKPKPSFTFGVASAATDSASSKPGFNFLLQATSSATALSTTTVFGSTSSAATTTPASTFVFGQSSVSSSGFASGVSDSTPSKPFMFGSQDNKPSTTPSTAAITPFIFGAGTTSASATTFNFGAAVTGSTSSTAAPTQFVFGSGISKPNATPAFGSSPVPSFGQGSSQSSAPSFGSTSASLFPANTFGSQAANSQPPAFGQQPNQTPAFGSGVATASGPAAGGFQFGSTSTFGESNSGVFAFGGNPGASTSTAKSSPAGGFQFNQTPTFNIGTTKSLTSSTSGRKIKTALRRRK
ncbi:nuclear pore complex protein Nup153 isoform X1 [Erpetoichthys calabaricus]|uniref:nuclear pore complex protein Nup153 isoform X1 n=1 Tax=Erpetoichthys calabaricus TaxID=27687 RepID=UPI0022341EFE|nr:nuclear pore complex protein Nup153 isoform X1 [Erpetoichthys calabaricus]